MDTTKIKEELEQYFQYIKTIYLNEFSRFMTEDTKNRIQNLNNVIELDLELSFKCYVDDYIHFNLNMDKYRIENKLSSVDELEDISDASKKYVGYLLTTPISQIIKNKFLHLAISLFVENTNDVVASGVISMIEEYLGNKYKLYYEKFIPSKEKKVALYIKKIIGEIPLLEGVINNNPKIIKDNYNLYIYKDDLDDYDEFIKSINNTYQNYEKKKGKVYLTDSLYEYDNLDYKIDEKLVNIQDEKHHINDIQIKRLSSIKKSLINISKHKFLFNALEIVKLENALIEIDKIIDKITSSGQAKMYDYIGEYYQKIIDIENDSKIFINKIWRSVLTAVESYIIGEEFNFLIAPKVEDEIVEAMYLSSEHLRKIKASTLTYGFIYEPNDAIKYVSSKDVMYKKIDEEDYNINYNSLFVGSSIVELDNQEDSCLITPDMILKNNLRDKNLQSKIILDGTKAKIIGIYAFIDEDKDKSPNYEKALILSETYNVPIVPIDKNKYYIKETEEKIPVKMNIIKEPKKHRISLLEKLKNVIYEDEDTKEIEKTA